MPKKGAPSHSMPYLAQWDPLADVNVQPLSTTASNRIRRDLLNMAVEPPPGVFAVCEETNMRFVHALIVGPADTPYEGGLFYFIMKCPTDYPIHPPKVKLLTTNGGKVRFNPNLYENGKVCLSILGTWDGPVWSPAQQLSGLLVSMQSIMNETPYHNEPGHSSMRNVNVLQTYNDYVRYQTIKVAVVGMMRNECQLNMPAELREKMEESFFKHFDRYMEIARQNLHLDGQTLKDKFSVNRCLCSYKTLIDDLENLHVTFTNKAIERLTQPPLQNDHHEEAATSANKRLRP